jgi:hypothetical protein
VSIREAFFVMVVIAMVACTVLLARWLRSRQKKP